MDKRLPKQTPDLSTGNPPKEPCAMPSRLTGVG
jgi:hypothetical protein